MDVEHYLPPEEPLDALTAATQLDERSLHHIRTCTRCRVAWYHSGAFRAGCTDPRIGARVLGALDGRQLAPPVAAHLEGCLACRFFLLDAKRAGSASRPARKEVAS